MKLITWFLIVGMSVATASCSQTQKHAVPSTVDAQTLTQTRDVASQLVTRLGAKLKQEIASNGPASAVDVCQIAAPEIATDISKQQGWQVGRVGTRVRNQNNQPNTWQQAALTQFSERAAKGEKFDTMETYEIVQLQGKNVMRYAKAIAVQPMCVTCHGKAEQIPPEVKARLQEKYPADQAIGYSAGELRGAVIVERPL